MCRPRPSSSIKAKTETLKPDMNATLFDGGKVHRLLDRAARCGVGKNRQRRDWQMDLGEVTCLRCAKAKPVEQPRSLRTATDKN